MDLIAQAESPLTDPGSWAKLQAELQEQLQQSTQRGNHGLNEQQKPPSSQHASDLQGFDVQQLFQLMGQQAQVPNDWQSQIHEEIIKQLLATTGDVTISNMQQNPQIGGGVGDAGPHIGQMQPSQYHPTDQPHLRSQQSPQKYQPQPHQARYHSDPHSYQEHPLQSPTNFQGMYSHSTLTPDPFTVTNVVNSPRPHGVQPLNQVSQVPFPVDLGSSVYSAVPVGGGQDTHLSESAEAVGTPRHIFEPLNSVDMLATPPPTPAQGVSPLTLPRAAHGEGTSQKSPDSGNSLDHSASMHVAHPCPPFGDDDEQSIQHPLEQSATSSPRQQNIQHPLEQSATSSPRQHATSLPTALAAGQEHSQTTELQMLLLRHKLFQCQQLQQHLMLSSNAHLPAALRHTLHASHTSRASQVSHNPFLGPSPLQPQNTSQKGRPNGHAMGMDLQGLLQAGLDPFCLLQVHGLHPNTLGELQALDLPDNDVLTEHNIGHAPSQDIGTTGTTKPQLSPSVSAQTQPGQSPPQALESFPPS